MTTLPTPDGPLAAVRPLEAFDPEQAGRIAVVIGPRGHRRRFAHLIAATTGVEVTGSEPPPGEDTPTVLRSDEAAGYAGLGTRAGRLAEPGESIDCLLAAAGARQSQRFATAAVVAGQRSRSATPATELRLWCETAQQAEAVRRGVQVGARVLLARQLGNTPSNRKSPAWLAAQAALLPPRVRVTTHDTSWLARQGFGGLLAVGAGSRHPPNLTKLEYRGGDGPHVVLVGKGITFDSGGLSLKPADAMTMMKTDMSGAAAVVATIGAAADLRLPVRLTGLIPCAENMPSGSAMRPGDVIRHVGGRTTEVRNTDAEGRLVLADALAYAARRLHPDLLVDVATLTGAATLGLGRHDAALFTTDDRLAQRLTRAGDRSGERVWRLPLAPEYAAAIASPVADAANASTDPTVQGGAITAALFLQPFARGTRWAHLDIAGTGRTESDRPDCRKGATGFGVSLLTQLLADQGR